MKKSLLIAGALLMSGSMFAETNLYMGEVKMEAGQTYTYNEVDPDMEWIDPELTVKGDSNASIAFSFKCTTGQTIMYCGTGACFMVKEGEYNGNLNAEGIWKAEIHYIPEEGVKDVTLDLKLDGNSYTLILDSSTGKVSMIQQDRNVAFSNNALVYSLSNTANAAVYDMQGRKVLSTVVNGNGTLDLNSLGRGAYIYRIGNISGKVLVK